MDPEWSFRADRNPSAYAFGGPWRQGLGRHGRGLGSILMGSVAWHAQDGAFAPARPSGMALLPGAADCRYLRALRLPVLFRAFAGQLCADDARVYVL